IRARQAEPGRRDELAQSLTLGRARTLPRRHRDRLEPVGGECGPEIAAELGGVPAHERARRALASDSRDDRHHLREGRHAVEDAADLLELVAEALERLGPALR